MGLASERQSIEPGGVSRALESQQIFRSRWQTLHAQQPPEHLSIRGSHLRYDLNYCICGGIAAALPVPAIGWERDVACSLRADR